MPRKAFIRDLQEASEPDAYPGLVNVKPGDDDGTVSCSLLLDDGSKKPVDIQLLVSGTLLAISCCSCFQPSRNR